MSKKQKEKREQLLKNLDDKIKKNSELLKKTSESFQKPAKKKRKKQGKFGYPDKFPPAPITPPTNVKRIRSGEDDERFRKELMKLQSGYRRFRKKVGIKRKYTHTKVPQVPEVPKGWKRKRKISLAPPEKPEELPPRPSRTPERPAHDIKPPVQTPEEPAQTKAPQAVEHRKRRSVTPPPRQRGVVPGRAIATIPAEIQREPSRPQPRRSRSPDGPDQAVQQHQIKIEALDKEKEPVVPKPATTEDLRLRAIQLLSSEPVPARDPHERNWSWNHTPNKAGAHERNWSFRSNRSVRLPRNTSTLSRLTVDFDNPNLLLPRETSIMSKMSEQTAKYDRDIDEAMMQNFEDLDEEEFSFENSDDEDLDSTPAIPIGPGNEKTPVITESLPFASPKSERNHRPSWIAEWRSEFIEQLANESRKVEEENRRRGMSGEHEDMTDAEYQMRMNAVSSASNRKSGELSMAEIKFEEYRLNSMFKEIQGMKEKPKASPDSMMEPMSPGEKRKKVEQIRHSYLESHNQLFQEADEDAKSMTSLTSESSYSSALTGAASESGGSTLPSLNTFRRTTPHAKPVERSPLDSDLPNTIKNRLPGKVESSSRLSTHGSLSGLRVNTRLEGINDPTRRLPDSPSSDELGRFIPNHGFILLQNPGNQQRLLSALNSDTSFSLRQKTDTRTTKPLKNQRTRSSPDYRIDPTAKSIGMPNFPPLPPVTPDFDTSMSNSPKYHQYVNRKQRSPGNSPGGKLVTVSREHSKSSEASSSKRHPSSFKSDDIILLGGDPVE